MKNILITGANSYIGTSFEKWVSQWPDKYTVDTIDMIGDNWREKSFKGYDVVFHVAGIAHIRETKKNTQLYYKINRDLAHEVANKAKNAGVSQFIFLSSMSIYGLNKGKITSETEPDPNSNYAKSKYEAEKLINNLHNSNFKIAIIRPPIVYGNNCKGNYLTLSHFAKKAYLFPKIENKRSMIFIYNLCEFTKLIIDSKENGVFFPQNEEYVCTSRMVELISKYNNKKIFLTRMFNWLIKLINIKLFQKIFGDLYYEKSIMNKNNYCIYNFEDSIKISEN